MIEGRVSPRRVLRGPRRASSACTSMFLVCVAATANAGSPLDSTGVFPAGPRWPARNVVPLLSAPAWTFAGDAATLADGTPATRWSGALGIGLRGPFGAELRTSAAAAFEPHGGPRTRNEVRLTYAASGAGGWLGAGRDDGFDGESSEAIWSVGGWVERQGVSFTARLERLSLVDVLASATVAVLDTNGLPIPGDGRLGGGEVSSATNATAGQLGVRWSRARWSVEAIGGLAARHSGSPYRWFEAGVAVPIRPGLTGFATAGSPTPQWLALDPVGDRRASLGLRFTGWSPAARALEARPVERLRWRLVRGEGEEHVLTVRLSGARVVEVMGDATEWVPLRLGESEAGHWNVALRLPPGVHELNLRIDGGAWLPPPGVPTRRDEYNGEVGVVVID